MPESKLSIFSWNVSEKRKDNEIISDWLLQWRPDGNFVMCLQEVSTALLQELTTKAERLGLAIRFGLDKKRLQKDGRTTHDCYLVIITDQEILGQDEWITSDTSERSFLTNCFIGALRLVGKWDDTAVLNGGISADIMVGGRRTRVINTHLSLTDPMTRRDEFMQCLKRQGDDAVILCGDFNILQGVMRLICNIGLAQSIPYATYRSERKEFNSLLDTHLLSNPHAGKKTHAAGQLDHILLDTATDTRLNRADVFPNRMGSDHNPVTIELLVVE